MGSTRRSVSVVRLPVIEGLEGRTLLSSAWVGTWNVQLTMLDFQGGGTNGSMTPPDSTPQPDTAVITQTGPGQFHLSAGQAPHSFQIDMTGTEDWLQGGWKGQVGDGGVLTDVVFRLRRFEGNIVSIFESRIDYNQTNKKVMNSAEVLGGFAAPAGTSFNFASFRWPGTYTTYSTDVEGQAVPKGFDSATTDATGSITIAPVSGQPNQYTLSHSGDAPEQWTLIGNQLFRSYEGVPDGGGSSYERNWSALVQGPGGRLFYLGGGAEFNAGAPYINGTNNRTVGTGQMTDVWLDSGYTAPFNAAPVLTATPAMHLTAINEEEPDSSNPGTPIPDLLASAGGGNITDADAGATQGIALTGVKTAYGTWQYSTDSGVTWNPVGAVSDASALLLANTPENYLRLIPAKDYAGGGTGAITFRAWDQTAKTNGARVNVSVNGGTRAYSTSTATASIRVRNVNDAPVLSAPVATVKYVEGAAPVSPFANVTLTDVDSPNMAGATISISSNYTAPEDKLMFTNTAAIVGSIDAASGTLTLTGTASQAAYQAAIRSITYRDKSANPNTTARTLSVTVNDGALASNTSNTLSQTVAVKAVNTAPVVTAGTITLTGALMNKNFPITFDTLNTAIQNALISYSDVDTDPASLGFQVTAISGTLKVGGVAVSSPVLLMPTGTIAWRPATNATGKITALQVRIWDGWLASSAFVTVLIRVA